jgi:hypothetical protein
MDEENNGIRGTIYKQFYTLPEKNERYFKRILTRLLFKCIYTRLTRFLMTNKK